MFALCQTMSAWIAHDAPLCFTPVSSSGAS